MSHKVRCQCVFVCAAIEQYINSPCCWIYRRIAAVCVSTMLYNLHTYVMRWSCRAVKSHTHMQTSLYLSLSLFTLPSHAQACGLCTHTHPHTQTHIDKILNMCLCVCALVCTHFRQQIRALSVCVLICRRKCLHKETHVEYVCMCVCVLCLCVCLRVSSLSLIMA